MACWPFIPADRLNASHTANGIGEHPLTFRALCIQFRAFNLLKPGLEVLPRDLNIG
jgi:hypothetical protein